MEQIGFSLDHFLGKAGLKKQLDQRQLFSYWPKIAGEQIINNTRLLTIKDHVLWIEVPDSTWLYHLTMIKFKIIADFNSGVGQNIVKDIKFVNADFKTKKQSQTMQVENQAKRPKFEEQFGEQKVTFLMDKKDRNKLEEALQQSPPSFQLSLQKMFQTCYHRQRFKKESGAKICKNCNGYAWEYELKEGLCPCCYPVMESWIDPLRVLYHREPWLHFTTLFSLYPTLNYNIYLLCKKKILKQYGERLINIMGRTDLDSHLKRKILSRLAQRYVMLVEEKKPEEIELEQVFTTLKPFPGLYQYLYNDPFST